MRRRYAHPAREPADFVSRVRFHMRFTRRASGPSIAAKPPGVSLPPDLADRELQIFDGFTIRGEFVQGLDTAAQHRAGRTARLITLDALRPANVVAVGAAAYELLECDVPWEYAEADSIAIVSRTAGRSRPMRFPAVPISAEVSIPAISVASSRRRVPASLTVDVGGLQTLSPPAAIAWAAHTLPPRMAFLIGSRLLHTACQFTGLDVPGSRTREGEQRDLALSAVEQIAPRGRARTSRVIASLDGGCGSVPELMILWALRQGGLSPQTQYPILVPGREYPYVVDFAFTDVRLVIEFDGWGKRGSTIAAIRASFVDQARRQHEIEDQGWEFERFTPEHLDDLDALVARVRARIERIRARMP